MNSGFSALQLSHEAATEAWRQRAEDRAEARGLAAEAIEAELSGDEALIADIVADVIVDPDFAETVADHYAAGRIHDAGAVLTSRIEVVIKRRAASDLAERDEKAREDAVAERWLAREGF